LNYSLAAVAQALNFCVAISKPSVSDEDFHVISVVDSVVFPTLLGRKMQVAFVVRNLEEALHFWTATMKVGPFVVIEESLGDRLFVHRDVQSPVDMSIAYSYLGDVQIEIIAQRNSAPSPYTEFLESGREGLHHVAFWPDEFETACQFLEEKGFQELSSVRTVDGEKNLIYYNGPSHLGVVVEVLPMTPLREKYYGGMKRLAETWDGSRPIRRYRTRSDYMASEDFMV
jgi:catechol 2,3-dioxygenase-like lactoylglutathione lyase family enzyme